MEGGGGSDRRESVKRQQRIISSRMNIRRVSEAPCVNMSRVSGFVAEPQLLPRDEHTYGSFLFTCSISCCHCEVLALDRQLASGRLIRGRGPGRRVSYSQ
jgi:hypothetical protein